MKQWMKRGIAKVCLLCMTAGIWSTSIDSQMVAQAKEAETAITTLENKTEIALPVVADVSFDSAQFSVSRGTLSKENQEDTIPVEVTQRTALNALVCAVTSTQSAVQAVTFGVYQEDGTKVIDSIVNSQTEAPKQNGEYHKLSLNQVIEPGNYYVKVSKPGAEVKIAYEVRMIGYRAAEGDAIPVGLRYSNYAAAGDTVYQKITLDKDGAFAVSAYQYNASAYWETSTKMSGIKLALCDENKKPLVKQMVTSQEDNFLMSCYLKKGTYYIRVKGTDCYYFLKTAQVAGKLCADKKTAARKMKVKEKTYVLPLDGTKSAGWFTYNVKTPTTDSFNVGFAGTGKVKVVIYQEQDMKKVGGSTASFNGKKYAYFMQGSTTKKKMEWPAGKYYIKVVRASKNVNGEVKVSIG